MAESKGGKEPSVPEVSVEQILTWADNYHKPGVPRASEVSAEQILTWADNYHKLAGRWPGETDGSVAVTAG